MSKKAARERKQQRAKQRQRQQQITILAAVGVVAVIAVALIIIANQPVAAPVEAAAAAEMYAGIPQGVSAEGLPQLGSEDAPLTIYDYSSFGCPHCADFHDESLPRLLEEVRAGNVRFVLVPITNDFSAPASAASFCAFDQGMFWEMHDTLFGWLDQYGGSAFVQNRIMGGAEALGLDMDEFTACLNDTATFERMEAANGLFQALASTYDGVTGTPTLTFNGNPVYGSGNLPYAMIEEQLAAIGG